MKRLKTCLIARGDKIMDGEQTEVVGDSRAKKAGYGGNDVFVD